MFIRQPQDATALLDHEATPQPRVFVVHDDGRLDLSKAERFGTLTPVFRTKLWQRANDFDLRAATGIARAAMADATEQDWLLVVGSPALIGLCAYVFVRQTNSLRLLMWDKQLQDYVPNTMEPVELGARR